MTQRMNKIWRLAARPVGRMKESDFSWHVEPVRELRDGEVLAKSSYLSLDPASRGWVSEGDSYLPPVGIGEVMRGFAVGTVEESRHPDFKPGDLVQGGFGWQLYALAPAKEFTKLPANPAVPLTAHVAVFNHIGLTAYFGLMDVGKPKAGETLVVSAAAGAVGSLVGQIGKIQGCRVVGIAGSPEKCRWLTEDLGFDAAINYKKEPVRAALRKHCPKGIDVDFENVGGEILDAVLGLINRGGRIALCGLISQYNATEPVPGPYNLVNLLVKRARMEGFIVLDYLDRANEAFADLGKWLAEGRLKYRLDVVKGLENAPRAVNRLFEGQNVGKLAVEV